MQTNTTIPSSVWVNDVGEQTTLDLRRRRFIVRTADLSAFVRGRYPDTFVHSHYQPLEDN